MIGLVAGLFWLCTVCRARLATEVRESWLKSSRNHRSVLTLESVSSVWLLQYDTNHHRNHRKSQQTSFRRLRHGAQRFWRLALAHDGAACVCVGNLNMKRCIRFLNCVIYRQGNHAKAETREMIFKEKSLIARCWSQGWILSDYISEASDSPSFKVLCNFLKLASQIITKG